MRAGIVIIGKLLLIGLLTTFSRIIGQLFIPQGTQDVLQPSIFTQNGTMPIVFTIYGIAVYAIIAAMFLLVKDTITGSRVIRGLKYAFSCCLVWIVYLQEPLPHVAFIDRFTYPVADSISLLVMGLSAGFLLCEKQKKTGVKTFKIDYKITIIMTVLFVLGRFVQYRAIDIYSNYGNDKWGSLLWATAAGLTVSLVMQWLNDKLRTKNQFAAPVLLGVVLFGVDLFLFNFFMPLVFDADIPDLLVRTIVDIVCVTIGCFFMLKRYKKALC